MTRIDTTLPLVLTSPSLAGIAARGLRAMLLIEPCQEALCVNFLALGADGRYRSGAFYLQDGVAPVDPSMPTSQPFPADADELAETIARVVDADDRDGAAYDHGAPFTLAGWYPSHHGMGIGSRILMHMDPTVADSIAWLPKVDATNASAYEATWAGTMAEHVPQETLRAARLFARAGAFDPVAFDMACGEGAVGEARRAFVRTNPLVAVAALADDSARALVDAGMPVGAVIGTLPADAPVLSSFHGDAKLRRRSLARISGAHHELLAQSPMSDVVLEAIDGLPPEWTPRDDAQMRVFALLCRAAAMGYGLDLTRDAGPDWWRGAFAGAGGDWAAYYGRFCEAALGTSRPWPHRRADELMSSFVAARSHVVDDLFIPLANAYDAGNLLGLMDVRGEWMGPLSVAGFTALDTFAHRTLTCGMSLPAVADQGRRHRGARHAIKAVCERFPVGADLAASAWRDSPAFGAVVDGYTLSRRPPAYDATAPGALDAMLAAWRTVLPRRLRSLDAEGLAAALDREAAVHAATATRPAIH